MDVLIISMLGQDGITNGAVYALLALAVVLIFAVTRIIYIAQGEFLSWGALTMASLESGQVPATVGLLIGLGTLTLVFDLVSWKNRTKGWRRPPRDVVRSIAWNLGYPLALALTLSNLPLQDLAAGWRFLITLALVVPMGPMVYRVAFQPVAEASVLVLLIVSVAVHLALVGLGLLAFGPEGYRTQSFTDAQFNIADLALGGQTLVIVGAALSLIVILYLFFERSLYGKALRATAVNRTGARLMGIPPALAGKLTFLLAALIGAFSGVLVAPITTIYYDSGFLIGLKGFVAAILGGLTSYPLAAGGAFLVGLLESYSSFWASAFKDVIVFSLIIPVLLWRSFSHHHVEDEE